MNLSESYVLSGIDDPEKTQSGLASPSLSAVSSSPCLLFSLQTILLVHLDWVIMNVFDPVFGVSLSSDDKEALLCGLD